jgi:hypothetical protein
MARLQIGKMFCVNNPYCSFPCYSKETSSSDYILRFDETFVVLSIDEMGQSDMDLIKTRILLESGDIKHIVLVKDYRDVFDRIEAGAYL